MIKKTWESVSKRWIAFSDNQDIHREHLNTPAFLSCLPDLSGKDVIDVACGIGDNTNLLSKMDCRITGIDFCDEFIDVANKRYSSEKTKFICMDAEKMSFADNSFDIAVSFMALMDMEKPESVMKEVFRVLKNEGLFFFSIIHPCFCPPEKNYVEKAGKYAKEVGAYFDVGQHTKKFEGFQTYRYHWTLGMWIDYIIQAGFCLQSIIEPRPDNKLIEKHPHFKQVEDIPNNMIIVCYKKPNACDVSSVMNPVNEAGAITTLNGGEL